jgi:hypothetical protein
MARIRTIKPDFFRHLELYEAEVETGLPLRVAYSGLWTVCDREGRFKWQPLILKLDVLPFDEVDFSRVLDALMTRGFIEKYTDGTRDFGFIPSWHDHQIINNRESLSNLPDPIECEIISTTSTREARVDDAKGTRLSNAQVEGKGREGKGRGKERKGIAHASFTDSPVNEVFEYWQQVMKKPTAKLDAKRAKSISSALGLGYSVEDLKKAIDGCRKSEWHMGKNDRNTQYNDIELITRNATNVDKFIAHSVVVSKEDENAVLAALLESGEVPFSGNVIDGECYAKP